MLLLLDVRRSPLRVARRGSCSGLAAGLPFAYAFTRAQQLRRDAPALATGFVNSCATLAILVAAPLIGFTFALPGEGALGFAVVAVIWAAAALPLHAGRKADAVAPVPSD